MHFAHALYGKIERPRKVPFGKNFVEQVVLPSLTRLWDDHERVKLITTETCRAKRRDWFEDMQRRQDELWNTIVSIIDGKKTGCVDNGIAHIEIWLRQADEGRLEDTWNFTKLHTENRNQWLELLAMLKQE